MVKNIFLLSIFVLGYSCLGFSEIFDFELKSQPGEVLSQERSFVKLRFKKAPHISQPVFVYDIDKVQNPHIVPKSLFEKSMFLLDKGNMFFSKGEYLKAIAYYQKALEVNPEFILCYHNTGVSYFLLGEYNKSIDNFEEIIRNSPLDGPSYLYLGWIYKRLEHYRTAKKYLENAEEIFRSEKNRMFLLETRKLLDGLPKSPLY
jgi:tetratricopeptide (TPR) repeat protein